jgi:hypothetical protein
MYLTSYAETDIHTSFSWDDVYKREVASFEETGEEGEVW